MTYTKDFAKINRKSRLFFVPLYPLTNKTSSMNQNQSSFGRMELAQAYFPYLLPRSAWQKLKSLMLDDPELTPLATQKRRTYLPAEVNIIYQHLGRP